MVEPIFHVAVESEWLAARASNDYRGSTLGRTVDEVGFAHAAYEAQVPGVLERFYAEVEDRLVLLVIDPDRLTSPVEDVADPETGESFPHVLGPINRGAVVEVRKLPIAAEPDDPQPVPVAPAPSRRLMPPLPVTVAVAALLLVLLAGLLIGFLAGRA